MRCKCCDAMNARLWRGEYYCGECRSSIRDTIEEDKALATERGVTRSWHNALGLEILVPLLDKGFDSTKSDGLQEKISEKFSGLNEKENPDE